MEVNILVMCLEEPESALHGISLAPCIRNVGKPLHVIELLQKREIHKDNNSTY